MGWTTEIHVRERSPADVSSCIESRNEESIVLPSGQVWTGIFSRSCEKSCGMKTPDFAASLSRFLKAIVIAFHDLDGDFSYWLYQNGKLIDRHPQGILSRLLLRQRRILGLLSDNATRERASNLLERPPAMENLTQFQQTIGIQYGQMLFSDFDEADILPVEVMKTIIRTGEGF